METTAHVQAGWIGEVDLVSRPLGCTILEDPMKMNIRQTGSPQIEAACTVREHQITAQYATQQRLFRLQELVLEYRSTPLAYVRLCAYV